MYKMGSVKNLHHSDSNNLCKMNMNKYSKRSDDSHSSARLKKLCKLCLLGSVYTLHVLASHPLSSHLLDTV